MGSLDRRSSSEDPNEKRSRLARWGDVYALVVVILVGVAVGIALIVASWQVNQANAKSPNRSPALPTILLFAGLSAPFLAAWLYSTQWAHSKQREGGTDLPKETPELLLLEQLPAEAARGYVPPPPFRLAVITGSTPMLRLPRPWRPWSRADRARAKAFWVDSSVRVTLPRESPPGTVDGRPLRILFLWVFSTTRNEKLYRSLRRVGSVAMLQGGGHIPITAPLKELRSEGHLVLRTAGDLDKALVRFQGRGTGGSTEMLCSGGLWRVAVDRLLAQSDRVILDLPHYTSKHAGAAWEIGQLVDLVSTDRFLLVVHHDTDRLCLLKHLHSAWAAMAANSPNRLPGTGPITLYDVRDKHDVGKFTPQIPKPDLPGILTAVVDSSEAREARNRIREPELPAFLLAVPPAGGAPAAEAAPPRLCCAKAIGRAGGRHFGPCAR